MIHFLRDWHGEPKSHSETISMQLEHYSIQSQRIVLLAQNQQRRSGKSLKADMISHKTSAKTNKAPPLMQSTVAPPVKSEGGLKNISASQVYNTQMSPELSALSENSNNFLDGYTGTKPLIGLFRVVECRSEDGRTHVFLCHCCRIRSNKKDIIDHVTSSSHLLNYLMEKHPEQVDAVTADINDNSQLIQSLARKVEQEEGRGELKVINVPESLCTPLTGKSYHWCIKMLCNGWTQTSTQKSKITVKGPSINNTSVEGMPEKRTVVLSKWAKRKAKKRKMKKVANTVFKVSLPLTKGSVLLARMSFSEDSLPMSYSHSSASDLIPPPESQTEDCELDYDIGSFALNNEHTAMCTNSQLQQHLYSGDAEADQYKGPERIFTGTRYQEVDGSFSINEDSSQSEDITWKNDQKVYGERNYDRQHGSQETSSMNFTEEFKNEGLQKQNEELLHAVSHIQDWSSYNSSYRPEEGYAVQWYNSASQSKVGTRGEVPREERQEMSSGSAQCYYKQQPQNQYMAADHTSLLTVDVEQHGLSGESSCLDAAGIKMYPQLDFLAHSGSSAPQPRVQFLETEQGQLQTYMEFTANHLQTTPQSYRMQPLAYQTIYRGHGVMPNPNYSHVPKANPDHHFPHPGSSSSSSSGGCGGGMSQSNAFIPPVQALCYGTYSDPNFRDTGLPGLMISKSVDRTTPFMCAYPNFNSAYIATPYGDHSSTQWSGVPIE